MSRGGGCSAGVRPQPPDRNPPARHPPEPGRRQRPADPEDVLGPGAAQRLGQSAQPQPGIGHHDHRARPPARVHRNGQVDARGDQQATRCPGRTPSACSPAATRWIRRSSSAKLTVRVRPPRSSATAAAVVRCPGQLRRPRQAGRLEGTRRAARTCWPDAVHPLPDMPRRLGHVLGDQVGGPRIALHVGLRQPVEEIVEVALGEHRVPRSPQQQGRNIGQLGQALGHVRRARLGSGDRARAGCRPRSPRPLAGPPHRGRERPGRGGPRAAGPAGTAQRPRGRTPACERTPGRAVDGDSGQPDQSRRRGRRVVVHRRVGQHDPGQPVAVAQRPAERDRPAPVVRDSDHRVPRRPAPRSARPGRRSARPAAEGRRPARTSPCPAGRPPPPASRVGRCPGTGATGRTRWGCRARRAWSRPSARRRCPARARTGRPPAPSGAVSRRDQARSNPLQIRQPVRRLTR